MKKELKVNSDEYGYVHDFISFCFLLCIVFMFQGIFVDIIV